MINTYIILSLLFSVSTTCCMSQQTIIPASFVPEYMQFFIQEYQYPNQEAINKPTELENLDKEIHPHYSCILCKKILTSKSGAQKHTLSQSHVYNVNNNKNPKITVDPDDRTTCARCFIRFKTVNEHCKHICRAERHKDLYIKNA